jgi:hypothetical protein
MDAAGRVVYEFISMTWKFGAVAKLFIYFFESTFPSWIAQNLSDKCLFSS